MVSPLISKLHEFYRIQIVLNNLQSQKVTDDNPLVFVNFVFIPSPCSSLVVRNFQLLSSMKTKSIEDLAVRANIIKAKIIEFSLYPKGIPYLVRSVLPLFDNQLVITFLDDIQRLFSGIESPDVENKIKKELEEFLAFFFCHIEDNDEHSAKILKFAIRVYSAFHNNLQNQGLDQSLGLFKHMNQVTLNYLAELCHDLEPDEIVETLNGLIHVIKEKGLKFVISLQPVTQCFTDPLLKCKMVVFLEKLSSDEVKELIHFILPLINSTEYQSQRAAILYFFAEKIPREYREELMTKHSWVIHLLQHLESESLEISIIELQLDELLEIIRIISSIEAKIPTIHSKIDFFHLMILIPRSQRGTDAQWLSPIFQGSAGEELVCYFSSNKTTLTGQMADILKIAAPFLVLIAKKQTRITFLEVLNFVPSSQRTKIVFKLFKLIEGLDLLESQKILTTLLTCPNTLLLDIVQMAEAFPKDVFEQNPQQVIILCQDVIQLHQTMFLIRKHSFERLHPYLKIIKVTDAPNRMLSKLNTVAMTVVQFSPSALSHYSEMIMRLSSDQFDPYLALDVLMEMLLYREANRHLILPQVFEIFKKFTPLYREAISKVLRCFRSEDRMFVLKTIGELIKEQEVVQSNDLLKQKILHDLKKADNKFGEASYQYLAEVFEKEIELQKIKSSLQKFSTKY